MEQLEQTKERLQWEEYLQPYFSANFRENLLGSNNVKFIPAKDFLLALNLEDCQLDGRKLTGRQIELGLRG